MKLPLTRAATEFGVSRDHLQTQLIAMGHDVGKSKQWTLRQLYEALLGIGDRTSAKYRREAANAELAEIDVAKARREVVEVSEVVDLFTRTLQAFRARLLAMPATLGYAANPSDPITGREAVTAAIDALLPLLREDAAKAFAAGPLADEDGEGEGDEEDEE